MDILESLDVSVSGMTKLLWPRLLLYVVPAQYTGMLIPVSRCVQALAERGDLMVREVEELDPHFLSSMFQGPLLTPQTLLARLLVVAGSPFAGSELQAAALLLMQNLHSRIHRAVGAMWAAEIPLLLQYLQGKDESFPDSAGWEQRLLKVQHFQKARCREVSACLKEPRSQRRQEQPLKCCCGAAARLCAAASSSLSQAQGGSQEKSSRQL
ncbi:maestro heat-like repeat-containing protein family member 1 isoform X1 [Gallus gallus]|uniref:maestro heat-like repeat-containing protein family member 1 isoform X1 n=1 Tax=Gallus gallus TaxID=9031 RepID=UPI001AE27363|nr:maestro heat-like repeat-containing protein family member 1 isoform X1 [Gallus gallus]